MTKVLNDIVDYVIDTVYMSELADVHMLDSERVKGFRIDLYLHNVKRAIKGYNQVFYKPKVI